MATANEAGDYVMGIICFANCLMLNKFGVCESAMRKPEHISQCPHDKMRKMQKKEKINGG